METEKLTEEEKIDAANFGKRHKNKPFSDIIVLAYDQDKRESIDLFFQEVVKRNSELSSYFDRYFLEKAKLMLESLYHNSNVIDKNLEKYLNNIEIGLKKF